MGWMDGWMDLPLTVEMLPKGFCLKPQIGKKIKIIGKRGQDLSASVGASMGRVFHVFSWEMSDHPGNKSEVVQSRGAPGVKNRLGESGKRIP